MTKGWILNLRIPEIHLFYILEIVNAGFLRRETGGYTKNPSAVNRRCMCPSYLLFIFFLLVSCLFAKKKKNKFSNTCCNRNRIRCNKRMDLCKRNKQET